MKTEGTKYEMMFILSPMLTEDKRKKVLGELDDLLKSKDADVFHTDDWGKREIAYRIKRFEDGYYMIYYFVLPERKDLHEIDEHLRLDQDVLRHLIIRREDDYEPKDFSDFQLPEDKEKKKPAKKTGSKAKAAPKKEAKKQEPKEEVSEEKLNDKLDEIMADDDLDV